MVKEKAKTFGLFPNEWSGFWWIASGELVDNYFPAFNIIKNKDDYSDKSGVINF